MIELPKKIASHTRIETVELYEEYQLQLEKGPDPIFIPGHVVSSKNNMTVNPRNMKIVYSGKTNSYIRKTKPLFWAARKEFRTAVEGFNSPYFVEFRFIRPTAHAFDFINVAQVVQDQMKSCKWIADDSASFLVPLFVTPKVAVKKNKVGVYIKFVGDSQCQYQSMDFKNG